MRYTIIALKEKIREMYPEIEQRKISLGITWSGEKDAYVLKFRRGGNELITHLDRMDADDCMQNIRCVHLGIKVDQFIRNFEAREQFGKKVA